MYDWGLLCARGEWDLQVSEWSTQVGERLVEEEIKVVDWAHVVQHVLEEEHKFLVVGSLLDGISRGKGGGIES